MMFRQKQRFHASRVCRRRWFSCLMVVPRSTASKSSRVRNMKVASRSGVMLWCLFWERPPQSQWICCGKHPFSFPVAMTGLTGLTGLTLNYRKIATPWRKVALAWQPCRCYGACKTLGTYCWPMMRRMRRQNGLRRFHREWADQWSQ